MPQCTGLTASGLGLMRRGLFESVWLGSQAFYDAKDFNANIGAWNTASMETMSDVCVLCHRLRVRSVWLSLGWTCSLRACGSARRRSSRRRRSTRTSEPGTLRELRTWPGYALIAIACVFGVRVAFLDVCRPRCCLDASRRTLVPCWHSLLFRALPHAAALPHRSASQCGTKRPSCMLLACSDSLVLCGWHALCDMLRCGIGLPVDRLGLGCGAAWPIPLGHAPSPDRACGHACLLSCVTLLCASSSIMQLPLRFNCCSCAASRWSSASTSLRTHSLGPLDAACTECNCPSGLGADAARAL